MKGTSALAIHRCIARIAFSAVNVFTWILVFRFLFALLGMTGVALASTAALYALSQAATCLKLPLSAGSLRHGMRKNIIGAMFVAAAALILLAMSLNFTLGSAYALGLIGFAVFLGGYRALYRLPYKIEAREAHLHAPAPVTDMLIALAPAAAGILLALPIEPSWFLYGAAAILLFSAVPLFFVPDAYERFPWDYRETFRQLFLEQHRTLLWRSLLRGAEATALFLLWPIVIYLLLAGSYAALGIVFSLTLLVAILLHDTGRSLLERWRVHNSPTVEAAIVASAWVGRLTVLSPVSVVLIDSYAYLGSPRENIAPAHFERSADGGLYLDERTVLKEMGESLGRIFACFIAAVFAFAFSATFAFITCFLLAAGAAAIGVLLNRLPVRSV